MNDSKNLPKIELHCHLDGSLDPAFVQQVLRSQGEELELPQLMERLRAPEDCASLAEYLQRFDLPIRCLDTPEHTRQAAKSFLASLSEDGVRYVEVRFAPALLVTPSQTARQSLEAVLEGLEDAHKQGGAHWGVIVCAMRHHSPEQNLEMLRLAREYLGQGVCAVDLAGDEAGRPNGEFFPLFAEARRLELPFTIHAGECGSAQSVADALEMGARRIGHGIAMVQDEALMRRCAQLGVGVELCPVSNLQTKAVRRWEDYPLQRFLENGLLATVNTDNRTVSGTSLTREFSLLQEHAGLTPEQQRQLCRNAAACAFAPDSLKHTLLELYK